MPLAALFFLLKNNVKKTIDKGGDLWYDTTTSWYLKMGSIFQMPDGGRYIIKIKQEVPK